ncbi:hypothetical protein MPSEU_000091000 [Mayamaea pseudoterrestris]|nr:hypothetical protein MPSEU_000091000 [Mayamaea pseudoterrestris]
MTSFHIVGDAFVDLVCILKDSLPEPGGDAELTDPVNALAGGSGVNTATHLQALLVGRSCDSPTTSTVLLHTALNPNDDYGQLLLRHADQHGFYLNNCQPSDSIAATGHCLAIVSKQERSFLTHRGCVADFSPEHVEVQQMIDSPKPVHLHVAGYYNMPHFWNGKLKQMLKHVRSERHSDRKITCMSLVPQHDASGAWSGGIDQLLSCLDFLILNLLEAQRIMERGLREQSRDDAIGDDMDAIVKHFQSLSRDTMFVVTRGANGAITFRDGEVLAELKHSVHVQVIDPTGAGDAFTAGFLEGIWAWKVENRMLHDASWPRAAVEEGLFRGCAAGTACVKIKGASTPADCSTISSIMNEQRR